MIKHNIFSYYSPWQSGDVLVTNRISLIDFCKVAFHMLVILQ